MLTIQFGYVYNVFWKCCQYMLCLFTIVKDSFEKKGIMGKSRGQSEIIRQFIVDHVSDHPQDISRFTADKFGISRQAVIRHIGRLISDGLISASGKTRNIQYALKPLVDESFELSISADLEEDKVWRERVSPLLKGIAPNVKDICQYGFTEMLNNVVSRYQTTEQRETERKAQNEQDERSQHLPKNL